METKHTPGPWYVQDDHGRRYIETEGNDDTIAEIHRRRSKGSVYSCAEAGANASLISAAPDLLAALERCELLLRSKRHACEDSTLCHLLDSHITQARAAIAKATA